jgi:hypothetical protein
MMGCCLAAEVSQTQIEASALHAQKQLEIQQIYILLYLFADGYAPYLCPEHDPDTGAGTNNVHLHCIKIHCSQKAKTLM